MHARARQTGSLQDEVLADSCTRSWTLSTRLFTTRLDLIAELDQKRTSDAGDDEAGQLRTETASLLHGVVASMNLDNFVVRPKRAIPSDRVT